VTVRPSTAEDRCAAPGLNELESVDERECTPRAFEVTVVTIRSGTTAVMITAVDREAAATTVREQLASDPTARGVGPTPSATDGDDQR
jgi:hypothetical protein